MKKNHELILIIYNPRKKTAKKMAYQIHEYLDSCNTENIVFSSKNIPASSINSEYKLVITLGGDGTVLFCSRIFSPFNIPILAINFGEIGFITEIEQENWQNALDRFLRGKYAIRKHLMLNVSVLREGESVYDVCCLNDCVITATGGARIINLDVYVDEVLLGKYRADGIIVSTPTGSTAYSAAAGGPLLYPEMDAVVLTPICPYSLSNRAIILPIDRKVKIYVTKNQRVNLVLTADGQEIFRLKQGDVIVTEKSDCRAHLVKAEEDLFFTKVKSKLNWAGGPNND